MKSPAAAWAPCPGEAHRNADIDGCGICAPEWGRVPVAMAACPKCEEGLTPDGEQCWDCGASGWVAS